MITVGAFLGKVKEISERDLTYRTGGSGSDGTCDCIGLIMGAMNELGHSRYDLHSSNYFARYQMETLEPVDQTDITPGLLVYKAREKTAYVPLNDRYLPGGRYYNGDLLDYYHVGVVESADPLVIVHCTENGDDSGIVRDYKMGSWAYAGQLMGVDYDAPKAEPASIAYKAIVTAPSGKTVNLRSRPSLGGLLNTRVPIGATVIVQETARNDADEEWSRVTFNGMSGYMMTQYLQDASINVESSQQGWPVGEDEVRLIIPKSAAEALLRALTEVTS